MKDTLAWTTPQLPALSDEQWQGLARLADLVNVISGPFAESATATVNHALAPATPYDLARLCEAVLKTAEALRASGLLELVAINAELLADDSRLLRPLLGGLPEELKAVPSADLASGLDHLIRLLDKMEVFSDYAAKQRSGPAVRRTIDAADYSGREEQAEGLEDLLQTLGRLHRNGSLAWLRDVSNTLKDREQRRSLGTLAGHGTGGADPRESARELLVQAAMDHAAEDTEQLGGAKGLLHLICDPEVQRGLRALAVLPMYLEPGERDH